MYDTNSDSQFDFDMWARMARDDPDAFEDLRKRMIEEVIESASPEIRRRMQGLQWKIDQLRSTSSNPMACCLKISQMMWDSVLGDDGLLENMQQLNNPDAFDMKKPRESAKIIEINELKNDENS